MEKMTFPTEFLPNCLRLTAAAANKRTKMGAVNANVVISNPADRDRSWEGDFLVDTGATDSLVPRQHLEAIGLKPEA